MSSIGYCRAPSLRSGRVNAKRGAILTNHTKTKEVRHVCRSEASSKALLEWMKAKGAPEQAGTSDPPPMFVSHRPLKPSPTCPPTAVTLRTVERGGRSIDVTVADRALKTGDVALRIPENLIVTLAQIFEDGDAGELLTTNKLSELAVLTLYLCYEKKKGPESDIYQFIKELDRQAARGSQGAKSPLLWGVEDLELLTGSPVVEEIEDRLHGIHREYEELDLVWVMGSALFRNYPFEMPTEQFSFDVFLQTFAAIQGSIVHLQGVEPSMRFALVPLGPPLLAYSSKSKAVIKYDEVSREVQLAVDRDYEPGDQIVAWCGPQPNRRLLLNYGVVEDNNPYDKMAVTITIPNNNDDLFRLKRAIVSSEDLNLSTSQTFQLSLNKPVPDHMLPYLRLAFATNEADCRKVDLTNNDVCISDENEGLVLSALMAHIQKKLDRYLTSMDQDESTIVDKNSTARQVVAAKLLRAEKAILLESLGAIADRAMKHGGGVGMLSEEAYRGVKIV